jgi:hypothetical protein
MAEGHISIINKKGAAAKQLSKLILQQPLDVLAYGPAILQLTKPIKIELIVFRSHFKEALGMSTSRA